MIKAEWTNADALDLQPTCNQLATDTISRQAAIDEITEYGSGNTIYMSVAELKRRIEHLPSARPEIVRCKECKYAPKCYGDVLMRSRGGGYIYCPVEYCSAAERRTDETD